MKLKFLIPLLFALLYLVLPTDNSGIDGYAYAASVRWGNDLLWPHHLLYCYFGYWVHGLVPFMEPLPLMKLLNAVAGGACLLIFQKLLIRLNVNNASYFIVFVGACFGFMRFSTENETYVLPILFSLSGTFYYLKFLQTTKVLHIVISSLLFGVGVLFHQIHVFWYIGFVMAFWFVRPALNWKRQLIFMGGGSLLVSVGYLIAYNITAVSQDVSLIQFVLSDVYAGRVQTGITYSNFIMTPISLARTFLQVHGYMWHMIKDNPALIILPASLLTVFFISFKTLLKHSKPQNSSHPLFSKALFFSFVLQLCFAFYSVGNAEFMVMLPFLLVLWLVCKVNLTTKPILYISIVMLFWNLVFGLAPARFLDLDGSKQILKLVENNPGDIWVLKEPQKIENMLNYKGNRQLEGTILREDELPSYQNNSQSIQNDQAIFTDIIAGKEGLNRQGLLNNDSSNVFEDFTTTPIDTIFFFGGKRVISKLMPRQ